MNINVRSRAQWHREGAWMGPKRWLNVSMADEVGGWLKSRIPWPSNSNYKNCCTSFGELGYSHLYIQGSMKLTSKNGRIGINYCCVTGDFRTHMGQRSLNGGVKMCSVQCIEYASKPNGMCSGFETPSTQRTITDSHSTKAST